MDVNSKRFTTRRDYISKGIIDKYSFNINGKHFYDQETDTDIK